MLNHNEEQSELVEKILRVLNEAELLNNLVFVGSWCIHFYRHYFQEKFLEPVRTTDIDIDVNLLLKAKNPVSIPDLLEPLDFEVKFAGDNFIFLVHPALKIEFLSPEKGRNKDKPLKLPGFGITAQPLRFLELLEKEVITTDYKGLPVKVPHPVWFGIHKLIISQRRRSKKHNEKVGILGKSHKDVIQALEVLAMVIRMGEEGKIIRAFESLTIKQKKLANGAIKEHQDHIEAVYPELFNILKII